jgi:hypothetical protein
MPGGRPRRRGRVKRDGGRVVTGFRVFPDRVTRGCGDYETRRWPGLPRSAPAARCTTRTRVESAPAGLSEADKSAQRSGHTSCESHGRVDRDRDKASGRPPTSRQRPARRRSVGELVGWQRGTGRSRGIPDCDEPGGRSRAEGFDATPDDHALDARHPAAIPSSTS